MKNGCFVTMRKGTEERKFFLFYSGDARELLKNGWSEIIEDFHSLYKNLVA